MFNYTSAQLSNNFVLTPFISRATVCDSFIKDKFQADFEKCKSLKKKLTVIIKYYYINWSNDIIAEVASQSWTSGLHISCSATWTWSSWHGSCPMPHHKITIKS